MIAAARLVVRVERLLGRLVKAGRRTRRRSDSEAIHETRLATRRLDAGLDVWRDAMRPTARRRARRALRRLRRALGPAREAEVSAALLLARVSALASEAAPVLTIVAGRLERRAERARRRAAGLCRRVSVRRVRQRVERAWSPPWAFEEVRPEGVAAARARLSRRASTARSELAAAARSRDEEGLHGARLALKRWRYGLEWMATLDAGTAAAEPVWLRSVQGSLGALHDNTVLQATLRKVARGLDASGPSGVAAVQRLVESLEAEHREELDRLVALAAAEEGNRLLERPQRGA